MSFPSPAEAAARPDIGIDRFMWGSDYPHDESTFPNTREGLRRAFHGASEEDLRRVLGGNAAALYGFDLERLQPIADRVGPTVDELSSPSRASPRATAPRLLPPMTGARSAGVTRFGGRAGDRDRRQPRHRCRHRPSTGGRRRRRRHHGADVGLITRPSWFVARDRRRTGSFGVQVGIVQADLGDADQRATIVERAVDPLGGRSTSWSTMPRSPSTRPWGTSAEAAAAHLRSERPRSDGPGPDGPPSMVERGEGWIVNISSATAPVWEPPSP